MTDGWREHLGQIESLAREQGLDYLPVAYPGFSWHNLKGDALDAIPQ